MTNTSNKPRAVVCKDGDIIITHGEGIIPLLFIPRTHVTAFLSTPETAIAVLITDVGAAAIDTLLAANAAVEACTALTETGAVKSTTLRFTLPNGLVVAYTTDDNFAADRERVKALGIDLMVTDNSVDWNRQHASFLGGIIVNVSTVPPQLVGLHQLGHEHLAKLVRDALAHGEAKQGDES